MCVRRFPLESVEHQQWASQSTRPGVASFVKIMLVHMDILPLLTPMVDTCRGLVYLFLVFRNRRSSAALLRIFQKWGCSSASQQNTRPKTFSPVTSQACLAHWLKEVNQKGQNKVNHEGEQKQRLYMSLHMCGNERVYTCLHKYTYIRHRAFRHARACLIHLSCFLMIWCLVLMFWCLVFLFLKTPTALMPVFLVWLVLLFLPVFCVFFSDLLFNND